MVSKAKEAKRVTAAVRNLIDSLGIYLSIIRMERLKAVNFSNVVNNDYKVKFFG